MTLALQPFFQAREADVAHRASALAWIDELVLGQLLLRQADPADHIVRRAVLI